MFGSKNTKIKYQNLKFKKELERARQYRRMPRRLPKTALEYFCEKIGLNSLKAKLLVLLVIGLLFYLTFVPNFFFIKNVEIEGSNLQHKPEHEAAINTYLNHSKIWPQKNLRLLNVNGLKQALLTDEWAAKVEKIKKNWPDRLHIQLVERREFVLVETPNRRMIFSDDGHYLKTLDAGDTPPINLVKIISQEELTSNQNLSTENLKLISILQERIPEICRSTITYYTLNPTTNPDLEVNTAAGYKLFFDTNSDANETLDNLSVLLGKLSPNDKNRLAYIDLRIKNKAYVCYKDTACTQMARFQPPTNTGTSTSSNATSSLIITP